MNKANIIPKQGDIFWVNFGVDRVEGNEVKNDETIRPVVVVSNDIMNRFSPTIIVLAITNKIDKPRLPSHVVISREESKLKRDSIILGEQVRTVAKERLLRKTARLSQEKIEEVSKAYAFNTFLDADFFGKVQIDSTRDYVLGRYVSYVEDYDHEFKVVTSDKTFKEMQDNITSVTLEYTCAFLNHGRGRLFFGINNDGKVVGFKLSRDDKDKLGQAINNKLLDSIKPYLTTLSFQMHFHPVKTVLGAVLEDLYVLEIKVEEPADKSVVYYEGKFRIWTKLNGQVRKLTYEQITDFIVRKALSKHKVES